jgi:hypothetical protein
LLTSHTQSFNYDGTRGPTAPRVDTRSAGGHEPPGGTADFINPEVHLMIHSLKVRAIHGMAVAFSAAVLLAACGGGDGSPSPSSAGDPATSAGNDREDPSIRGGGPVATRQWMASLQIGSSHICGASLVADGWLLTAAHCVTDAQGNLDRPANTYRVCVGVQRLSDCGGSNVAGVSEIRVHPNWRGAVGNANNGDLALLRVNSAFSGNTKVVLASDPSHTPGDGGAALIRGWGRTDSDGPPATLTNELLGLNQTITTSGCPAGHVCAVAHALRGHGHAGRVQRRQRRPPALARRRRPMAPGRHHELWLQPRPRRVHGRGAGRLHARGELLRLDPGQHRRGALKEQTDEPRRQTRLVRGALSRHRHAPRILPLLLCALRAGAPSLTLHHQRSGSGHRARTHRPRRRAGRGEFPRSRRWRFADEDLMPRAAGICDRWR